jgi:hypothetical protein
MVAPEETPQPQSLGLERLSLQDVKNVAIFVDLDEDESLRLKPIFRDQLHGMAEAHLDTPFSEIEALAREDDDQFRCIGLELLAHLAPRQPEMAFPLWRELITDPVDYIRADAGLVLARHLGVLALDPERVVDLIKANFEAERKSD